MVKGKKEAVVKIDSDLLGKVEEFINEDKNKLIYVNKKQFVDIAVYEKLKKDGRKGKPFLNPIKDGR